MIADCHIFHFFMYSRLHVICWMDLSCDMANLCFLGNLIETCATHDTVERAHVETFVAAIVGFVQINDR